MLDQIADGENPFKKNPDTGSCSNNLLEAFVIDWFEYGHLCSPIITLWHHFTPYRVMSLALRSESLTLVAEFCCIQSQSPV